ncbi:hypothetical protein Hdeb2414_s0234g00842931 [Helianthus debilis subsp. tardiflorus]
MSLRCIAHIGPSSFGLSPISFDNSPLLEIKGNCMYNEITSQYETNIVELNKLDNYTPCGD